MKASIKKQPGKTSSKGPLQVFFSRLSAYKFVAVIIAVGIYSNFLSYNLLWLIPYALLYPYFIRLATARVRQLKPKLVGRTLLCIDVLHSGAVIAAIGFALIPSMMLVLIIAFSTMIIGGVVLMLLTISGILIASAIASLVIQPEVQLQAPLLLSVVSILFAALYICLIAHLIHKYNFRITELELELKRQQHKAVRFATNSAKYLSPQVWQTIFNEKQTATLSTQRKKLTVFFSDIRGFTELSEELEAEALTDILNHYLNEMSKIVVKYGGTIDKFMGDSVMVFFGDPNTQGAKKDALAAVSMAIEMRKHMKSLRQQWRAQGIDKPLEIRMGINTGYCTVGNFGAATRMDYTIIGREVNFASRLESAAEPSEILISNETHSLIQDVIMTRDKGQINVKGFSRPVQIFQVVDFRRDLGASWSYVEHQLPGFSMYLDTNNIKSYDKERVIKALNEAAERLRDKIII